MSRKSIMIALAAVVALGTAMVSIDNASAAGFRNFGHTNVGRVNFGRVNVGRVNFNRVSIRGPLRPGRFIRPIFPRRPHWVYWHHQHRLWYLPRPVVYGAVTPVVTTATTSRCTCLTKEYTPEGAVLFKDICTNEAAMNPPAEQPAPTAQVQPQQ